MGRTGSTRCGSSGRPVLHPPKSGSAAGPHPAMAAPARGDRGARRSAPPTPAIRPAGAPGDRPAGRGRGSAGRSQRLLRADRLAQLRVRGDQARDAAEPVLADRDHRYLGRRPATTACGRAHAARRRARPRPRPPGTASAARPPRRPPRPASRDRRGRTRRSRRAGRRPARTRPRRRARMRTTRPGGLGTPPSVNGSGQINGSRNARACSSAPARVSSSTATPGSSPRVADPSIATHSICPSDRSTRSAARYDIGQVTSK